MIFVYLLSRPAVFRALRIFGAVICVSGDPRRRALAGCHSASERRLTRGTGERWSSTATDEFHHISRDIKLGARPQAWVKLSALTVHSEPTDCHVSLWPGENGGLQDRDVWCH